MYLLFDCLSQGFSALALRILRQDKSLGVGGCCVHYKMFSNNPDLHPLDANHTSPSLSCDNQKCPRHIAKCGRGPFAPS